MYTRERPVQQASHLQRAGTITICGNHYLWHVHGRHCEPILN